MKKWILDTLFALTHIQHWVRNHSTSKELDKWFNKEIEKGTKFKRVYIYDTLDEYCAEFAGIDLWIKNIPYACFVINGFMPKRRTVNKLQRLLMKSSLDV